jgi:hypothetical protein
MTMTRDNGRTRLKTCPYATLCTKSTGLKQGLRVETPAAYRLSSGKGQLKCDGTRAETKFRLSAKRNESI